MSEFRVGRKSARESILSSLDTLGASQPPVRTQNVPRNKILVSLAAGGVSLAAGQTADAGSIIVANPNVNVGFANGNVNSFKFNLNTGNSGGLKSNGLELFALTANPRSVVFRGTTANHNNGNIELRTQNVVAPAPYGKTFSQVGTSNSTPQKSLISRHVNGAGSGVNFSNEYYVFSFLDTSSLTHYGWMYGTLSSSAGAAGYNDMSYNLISYAYDTTPNEKITTGQTVVLQTPEPSTLVMGAMAALVLGAAGVRRWKKDRQAKVETAV